MFELLVTQAGAPINCIGFFFGVTRYCGISQLDSATVSALNALSLASHTSVYLAIGVAIFFGLRFAAKQEKEKSA